SGMSALRRPWCEVRSSWMARKQQVRSVLADVFQPVCGRTSAGRARIREQIGARLRLWFELVGEGSEPGRQRLSQMSKQVAAHDKSAALKHVPLLRRQFSWIQRRPGCPKHRGARPGIRKPMLESNSSAALLLQIHLA